MSEGFAMWAIVVLLLALLPALLHLLRSRSRDSGALSLQLIGSGGVALSALLSVALQLPAALNVALLLALLAASTALVLTYKPGDDND